MTELITRCDACGTETPFHNYYDITIDHDATNQHDRWTLCKECVMWQQIGDLMAIIAENTADAQG